MVEMINPETRMFVLYLWFLGKKIEDIANQSKVSVSSVRNFVDGLKAGKYPEFKGFLPYLEGMRYLAKQMESNKLGLPQAITGLSVFNALVELGLEPEKLLELFRLLQRIAPQDFPQKEFVQAALRIAALEKETGLSYSELDDSATRLKTEIPELEARKTTLADNIGSLKASETEERKNLDKTLAAKKLTQRLLERYEHDATTVTSAGFKIEDVNRLAEFLTKATNEGYVAAAIELCTLEKRTGRTFDELLAEYKGKLSELEAARQNLSTTSGELSKLNGDVARLKLEMDEELKANKITRDQLTRHINTLSTLASIGVDFEQLDALARLLSNVARLGWAPQGVADYLKSINDLDEVKSRRESELADIVRRITDATNDLESLNNQTGACRTEIVKLVSDQTELRNSIAQLTESETAKKKHVELADNFIQLMQDPSKFAIEQLQALILEFYRVIGCLMQPEAHLYPPDFAPIRKKVLELFRVLLGTEFVPREEMDAERKRLSDEHSGIVRDRLKEVEQQRRKNEEGWREVQREKDEAAKMTRNAATLTKETALKLVVDLEAHGGAKSYTCHVCHSTFTICLGSDCKEPERCPSCNAPLIERIQRFR